MVLLDLPDHDSIVAEHRVRAERLVERTDLLAWVVDPQKYADAALHERFLRPLAEHSDIVIVVLNQIDRLAPADAEACLADLRRLVHQDGLVRARVLGVSARTGEGMDELRSLLMGAAARREAAGLRLAADVRGVARQLSAACAAETDAGGGAVRSAKGALVDTLATAAGVPVVVAAVRGAALRDARAATGWPVTRWLARLRPDPLRRIGLRPAAPRPDLLRSSLPAASTAARAAAQAAVRDYARQVTADLPDGWALAARSVVLDAGRGLPDALDQAVLGTDLGLGRRPVWWRVVGGLQWAALAVLIVGLGWLAGLAALGWLQLAAPDPPTWRGLPMPTGLLVVGLIAGLGLAAVARGCAIVGARRRAAAVGRRLRAAVGAVVEREVRVPMLGELDALRTCRMAAAVAGG